MNQLCETTNRFPQQTPAGLALVRRVEHALLEQDQASMETFHVLHSGVYSRTICLTAGAIMTGALIKIPTTLVISGNASVLVGDCEEIKISGYHVIAAPAGRKQAFIAHTDTWITMTFCTKAKTIEEVETEFTDEADLLLSRYNVNHITITGD